MRESKRTGGRWNEYREPVNDSHSNNKLFSTFGVAYMEKMMENKDKYYTLYGTWEQFSNFWDAVHYYSNYSESRRSPVISSTPEYVRVKEEDYVVFATIVKASGLQHKKSPGPYVEAL